MKTYKRRDSATSILRKLGIKPRDYDLFIKKTDDGVEFDDQLAKQHAANLKEQTGEIPKKKTPTKKDSAKTTSKKACCQVAYDLIKKGYSNQAVWDVIQPMFNLDDKKKHYPSWYRCHLRRIGELPQETRVRKDEVQVVYE